MNELFPILNGDPSDEERQLLGSVRLDVPSPAGKERLMVALGLGAHIAAASTGGAAASVGKHVALTSVWKWLAIGAVAGTATTTTLEVVGTYVDRTSPSMSERAAPSPTFQGNTATLPGERLRTREAPLPGAAEPSPPQAIPEPEGPRGTPAQVGTGAPIFESALPPEARVSLRDEVTALDSARSALRSGDPARAATTLDQYEIRFPRGRLAPEAALVRVEVMLGLGRKVDARRLAESLLASQPDSAHAQRLRTLLQAAGEASR